MAQNIAGESSHHGSGPVAAETAFFGHPRGLSTLFFTEFWERFSYYGMRALLVLFMVSPQSAGGLGYDAAIAGAIYGTFTASVYLLTLPGGWLADKVLGLRRAVLSGGVLIACGHYTMAVPSHWTFYAGLSLIALGTGLLKPNVSAIVGQLYGRGDERRDAGFTIFYMGINLGALLAPLICGYVGERINWHLGFALAGIGMTGGLIQFLWGSKNLGTAGHPPKHPDGEAAQKSLAGRVWMGVAAVGLVAAIIVGAAVTGVLNLTVQAVSDGLGVILLGAAIGVFAWLLIDPRWTPVERKRLVAVLVLFIAASLFWSVFEQAGSSLTLFAERNTNSNLFGFNFPVTWYQAMNPLFILLLGPVFAWLWVKLGNRQPSFMMKFVMGLFGVGAGFALLMIPAAQSADGTTLVSPLWLTGVYLIHTCSELCLSPVGLSSMTKLAPESISGLVMGVWFLAASTGSYLAGRIASVYESVSLVHLFMYVGGFAMVVAVLMLLLVKPVNKLAGGIR